MQLLSYNKFCAKFKSEQSIRKKALISLNKDSLKAFASSVFSHIHNDDPRGLLLANF